MCFAAGLRAKRDAVQVGLKSAGLANLCRALVHTKASQTLNLEQLRLFEGKHLDPAPLRTLVPINDVASSTVELLLLEAVRVDRAVAVREDKKALRRVRLGIKMVAMRHDGPSRLAWARMVRDRGHKQATDVSSDGLKALFQRRDPNLDCFSQAIQTRTNTINSARELLKGSA